ncbi:MAG: CHASE3 domain-containing protein [Caulobacterales bacterium]
MVQKFSQWREAIKSPFAPLAFGLGLLFLLLAITIFFANERSVQNAHVRETLASRAELWEVYASLRSMEAGQRGYLLTGRNSYLDAYHQGANRIPNNLRAFENLSTRTPEQIERLNELRSVIADKNSELLRTIDLRRQGRRAEAIRILETDVGIDLMQRASDLIRALLAGEERALDARLDSVRNANAIFQGATLATVIAVIALVWLSYRAAKSTHADLLTSRDAAQTAYAGLVKESAQRQSAEDQVRQMQKMEAIGQLTGGIAHDFNNMLAVITSSLTLMKRRLERNDQNIGQFVDSALDAAQRAATLTSRLLAFARQQPLEPRVVDINKLVSNMSELLLRTLGETISTETVLAGGLWKTHADAGQLENAIINLCVNARDAMPEGGKLTIETANSHLDDSYAARHAEVPPGQYVLICISDTGMGMQPDIAARAVDPFFTTKPTGRGTGLGLSQVYGYVKQSGGHVKIYSELGQGTTVKIYLPRAHAAVEEENPTPAETRRGEPTELILVVEDDDRVRQTSVATLRELGYTVIHAANGPEALEKLDAHPGVALLFTDVVMPAMSGRVLANEAKKRNGALKVLYTTGYTQNAVVHNGVLDRDAQLIMKPFTLDQLAAKVRDVLDA